MSSHRGSLLGWFVLKLGVFVPNTSKLSCQSSLQGKMVPELKQKTFSITVVGNSTLLLALGSKCF